MYDLIVIGAGPAGISSAYEMALKGDKKVLLLEKANDICQTFAVFYKDGKRVDKAYKGCDSTNIGNVPFEDGTKESTMELFKSIVDKGIFETKYGCEVESIKKIDGGFMLVTPKGNFSTKNYAVAIGRMGKPNKPDYKLPSSLKKVINFNANDAQSNEKILVVGGGNSAAEYAVDLSEKSKVTMCYRRTEFSRLNDINLENVNSYSKAGKFTLKLGTDIVEINDEDGKAKVSFNDQSSETYDRVIYAIGGSTPLDFLQKCEINVDENGVPSFDENTMQTNQKGVFVVGDIASKNGASIIVALNGAKKISDFLA